MAKVREHHMSGSAQFVSSSSVIARLSAELQIPAGNPVSSSDNNPDGYTYNYQFNAKMTIVILVIALAVLLLGIFAYYVLKCFRSPAILTRQPAVDRRLGQKNYEGIDRESIETFPVVAYSAASMAKNCTDCAVCLTDFQEKEKTRLLPKCNHAFHPKCIDMWLFSHSTCPLCRISLISESHTITIHSEPSQGSAR
ncbi:hypothetical protein O6H91_13G053900 [Diphasiastrum complanatum]|uniref:Uncharacterized protein n=1 Tax=Diphasiastrum complanatum TaxID=34168 RepID=A0ACC2BUT4_DIPCM|nr:hypothetical protein O6H91_13G053900 [Diphasiastrum complanatum]